MGMSLRKKIAIIPLILFSFVVAISSVLFLYVIPNWKATPNIQVGFIGPLTGPTASYGVAQMKGVELGIIEINAAGGVQGKELKVIFEDSQMEPNKSISAMKKLVDIDKVPAVIGETSTTATLAIVDIANRSKTVLFSPLASGAKLSDAGEYFFRASPSDSFQALVMATYVHSQGRQKGAVIYTNDDWGGGLQKAFQEKFQALGGG